MSCLSLYAAHADRRIALNQSHLDQLGEIVYFSTAHLEMAQGTLMCHGTVVGKHWINGWMCMDDNAL